MRLPGKCPKVETRRALLAGNQRRNRQMCPGYKGCELLAASVLTSARSEAKPVAACWLSSVRHSPTCFLCSLLSPWGNQPARPTRPATKGAATNTTTAASGPTFVVMMFAFPPAMQNRTVAVSLFVAPGGPGSAPAVCKMLTTAGYAPEGQELCPLNVCCSQFG